MAGVTRHRRDVDDVRGRVLREHARHERTHTIDRAPKIDPEDALPFGLRRLPGGTAAAHARIVDEHVYGTVGFERTRSQLLDFGDARDIGGNGQRAELRSDFGEALAMHVSDDESHAFAREFLSDRAADTTARAGYDGDFFAQVLHVAQGSKGCET